MSIAKGKMTHSTRTTTLGDPKGFSNSASTREVNTPYKPERPGDSESASKR